MSRVYLVINIMQSETGYAVMVNSSRDYRGVDPETKGIARGENLDADAAAATVAAALEQWTEHEEKQGWVE